MKSATLLTAGLTLMLLGTTSAALAQSDCKTIVPASPDVAFIASACTSSTTFPRSTNSPWPG